MDGKKQFWTTVTETLGFVIIRQLCFIANQKVLMYFQGKVSNTRLNWTIVNFRIFLRWSIFSQNQEINKMKSFMTFSITNSKHFCWLLCKILKDIKCPLSESGAFSNYLDLKIEVKKLLQEIHLIRMTSKKWRISCSPDKSQSVFQWHMPKTQSQQ